MNMSTETNNIPATDSALKSRLAKLRQDYELGNAQLRDITQQEAQLRDTLLRISGAIQVLEELLSEAAQPTNGDGSALHVP
jgi:septal ring factor EnvC (AmiA/AmiB activator)